MVARIQHGDTAAYATLVRAHMRVALAAARAILGRRADAEDVVQEAFLVALERIGSCQQPERFSAWLLTIVRNRARNRRAARRLREAVTEVAPPPGPAPARRVLLERRLIEALDTLSFIQRAVALLHDVEEWTHAEIGAALGISEVLSRQHLFKARRALRARMNPDGEQP